MTDVLETAQRATQFLQVLHPQLLAEKIFPLGLIAVNTTAIVLTVIFIIFVAI